MGMFVFSMLLTLQVYAKNQTILSAFWAFGGFGSLIKGNIYSSAFSLIAFAPQIWNNITARLVDVSKSHISFADIGSVKPSFTVNNSSLRFKKTVLRAVVYMGMYIYFLWMFRIFKTLYIIMAGSSATLEH